MSEALPEAVKPLFDVCGEAAARYMLTSSEQAFCDGFRIGLRIAAEVYFEAAQEA